jgi:hypothetical protein
LLFAIVHKKGLAQKWGTGAGFAGTLVCRYKARLPSGLERGNGSK